MDELAKRFADLAQQYGPGVIDVAKQAARVEALSCLNASLIWGGIGVVMMCAGIIMRKTARASDDVTDPDLLLCGAYCLMSLSSIAIAVAVWAWIDPWTWVALWHPEIWIAHKILKI